MEASPSSPQGVVVARRSFSLDDQQQFAALSHDRNPMHVDPVQARRLLTGRPVVHGVHTLLWALDHLQEWPTAPALHVECRFTQPISVGDHVELQQSSAPDGTARLNALVDGIACVQIEVKPVARGPAVQAIADDTPALVLQPQAEASVSPLQSHLGRVYLMPAWAPGLAGQFPITTRRFGSTAIGALGALSYMVGMVCPGLHSVFSSLTFTVTGTDTTPLRLRVREIEPRFRMATIAFDGPVAGELRAFERPQPAPQPAARELAPLVDEHEFAGSRALVVGGSRGLGELSAKLLAAGGGDVCITYALGRDDAQAIVDDINAAGRGRCRMLQLDLTQAIDRAALHTAGPFDAVYYFATPRIYRKSMQVFDRASFDAFAGIYLERFAELCAALEGCPGSAPVRVYLPSTVFIDARPKGLAAYAMVKAAAEVLAADLNRSLRRVQVRWSRLPRLATDQTAGVRGLSAEQNTAALLDVVRLMRA